jgi:hypothetical protein
MSISQCNNIDITHNLYTSDHVYSYILEIKER